MVDYRLIAKQVLNEEERIANKRPTVEYPKFVWLSRHPLTETQIEVIAKYFNTTPDKVNVVHENVIFDVDPNKAVEQVAAILNREKPNGYGVVMPQYIYPKLVTTITDIPSFSFINDMAARAEGKFICKGAWVIKNGNEYEYIDRTSPVSSDEAVDLVPRKPTEYSA